MTAARKGINKKSDSAVPIFACAAVLLASSAALVPLSRFFVYGVEHEARPIWILSAILLVAGGAWILAVKRLQRFRFTPRRIAAVIAFSLVLSGIQLVTSPIQEADFYRYLLDGRVLLCRSNPYEHAPSSWTTAVDAEPLGEGRRGVHGCVLPDTQWRTVAERVAYPHIRTPYPPLAELWFAGSVLVGGGPSVTALRVSYLGLELALLVALASLLARLGQNPLLVAAFGWAPLVFKENFNSAHYDILPAFLLVVSVHLLHARREVGAAVALSAGAAAKLFTAVLLPLWMRWVRRSRPAVAASAFALTTALLWLPFMGAGRNVLEGAAAFASGWTVSSPVFAPTVISLGALGLGPGVARAACAALLAALVVRVQLTWPIENDFASLMRAARATLALLLVCGPAANPWYFCWLLPLIALDPRPAWLALIAMQPLYYMRFHLIYRGRGDLLALLTWIEFAPFAVLLARDAYRNRSSAAGRSMSAARSAPATGEGSG